MNIIEFLEARITEDETEASRAIRERAKVTPDEGADTSLQSWPDSGVPAMLVGPERILAECAAKRALIAMHQTYAQAASDRTGVAAFGAECGRDVTADALRPLAWVYNYHPDYQEQWAASGRR